MKYKSNSNRSARFNASVCKWGALAILCLLAITVLPAVAAHPETMLAVGMLLPLGSRRFLKSDADAGGGISPEDFQAKVLKGVETLTTKANELEQKFASAPTTEEFKNLKTDFDKLVDECRTLRKAHLSASSRKAIAKGQVSDDAARYLGGIAIVAGLKGGQVAGDRYDSLVKDILGMEAKSAITTSDIPLPVEYSGEVVELVSLYGAARKYGTVFPLGAGTVKLPKLTTDPTFGLIASSASVTEKSPQVAWVTFNAEKFGGLIRLPSEIDEDSVVAIGQFVARYSARNLARAEDYNFFASTGAGSGVNGSVEGLTISTITNSKVVQMASTKTHYSDATLANFRAIRATVDAPAIGLGAYYMHPSFEQHLSGLNTAGDKPYIANGINGASLDGFPIRWVDVLPAYSTGVNASKVFTLFGDVSFQYLGVRGGIRMDTSKEAGFTTDEILMRAIERFTIGLMAVGAVSGLETAAS